MAESMVEKVAKALARHDNPKHENWWPSYENRARAAIEAMREPTANMILKGLVRSERDDIELTLEEVEDIWRAMIDDALTTN